VIQILTQEIVQYEMGAMTDEEEVAFFQKLIDSGMAWSLQGKYGRRAAQLIEGGQCAPAHQKAN